MDFNYEGDVVVLMAQGRKELGIIFINHLTLNDILQSIVSLAIIERQVAGHCFDRSKVSPF